MKYLSGLTLFIGIFFFATCSNEAFSHKYQYLDKYLNTGNSNICNNIIAFYDSANNNIRTEDYSSAKDDFDSVITFYDQIQINASLIKKCDTSLLKEIYNNSKIKKEQCLKYIDYLTKLEKWKKDRISADSSQRYSDSISAFFLVNVLSQARIFQQKEKYNEALDDYIDFRNRYNSSSANLQSFLDTIGLVKSISECQFRIGECYLYGKGFRKSISEAQKWYLLSANQGNADAHDKLLYCILIAQPTVSQPTSIKFKGFYIGMSISDAYILIYQSFSSIFGPMKLKEYNGGVKDAAYAIETNENSTFLFDKSKLLIKLYWSKDIVNQMFNVFDMSAEQFAQEFVNSYGIPKMDVGSDAGSAIIAAASVQFWEYISSDGVHLRIFGSGQAVILGFPISLEGKDLLLEKVPTRAARSFD